MNEDKKLITQKLFEVLKITRCGYNIADMEYITEDGDEYVIVKFDNGYMKYINVTADSGKAMIKDVVEWIEK